MKKTLLTVAVLALFAVPLVAGPNCGAQKAEKAEKLSCAAICKDKKAVKNCEKIKTKLGNLKKMDGMDTPQMKAVLDLLEEITACQRMMCRSADACKMKDDGKKAAYACPNTKCGMKSCSPGKCGECGKDLVKKS